MLDIDRLMTGLSSRRPIFHSEADFQHALAWYIHETLPECDLRLEREQFLPGTQERMATDIWIRVSDVAVAIELKYTNRALQEECNGEVFALRDHGAQPPRRYDFIKDVQRLEQALGLPNPADYGFAVLLTNNSTYWRPPRQDNIVDADFRIHDGRQVFSGNLQWSDTVGVNTKRNREELIQLKNSYRMRWMDYSSFGDKPGQTFRYLAIEIPPRQKTAP